MRTRSGNRTTRFGTDTSITTGLHIKAGAREEAAAKWYPVCAERYAHVPHFRCHLLSGRHDDRKTTNGEAKSDHSKIEWTGARLGRFLREAAELFNALERLRKGGE